MTALTQGRDTPRQETEILALPVAAGAVIHVGALVCVTAAGFAAPGTESADLVTAGRAEESADNTLGSDGDDYVVVRRKGAFKWENDAAAPVTEAHLFKPCYVVDDQTVSGSHETNTRSVCGTVVAIEADGVWVEIN